MRAVDQWQLLQATLPVDWEHARLSFSVEDPGQVSAAAGVLGPLGAGRYGGQVRIEVRNSAVGGPEALRNLLRALDRKRIWGTLELAGAPTTAVSPPADEPAAAPRSKLAGSWDAALEKLPPAWSDLLCELEMDSSDYLTRGALLGAPLNPTRSGDALALRFRVARTKGYGAPPGLVRRCLERMDADGITGEVTVRNALSETDNVATQGPVWRVAGRSV
jgi:hypothetical protein